MSRERMIPTADTLLYTVDSSGGAPPLLFLSGGFGSVRNWNGVIQRLAGGNRAMRFDAGRVGSPVHQPTIPWRPRSTTSTHRRGDGHRTPDPRRMVLRRHARGALRGAPSEQLGGLVLIDGAYPISVFDEAG